MDAVRGEPRSGAAKGAKKLAQQQTSVNPPGGAEQAILVRKRDMRQAVAIVLSCWLLFSPTITCAQGNQNKKKEDPKLDFAEIGRRDITKGKWNFYSPEREMALGRELATETDRTSRLLTDPEVVSYVSEVADRIARNSDIQVPVQVRVLDSDEVNAFALPGGFLYVTTGMLLETQSEAELAAVIAHEIAHVAARHATRQLTRAQIWNLMSIPVVLLGGSVAFAIQQGAALAVPLTFLKFSRGAEREADLLGLQYHYASGYDPAAFVAFFERVRKREKEKGELRGIAKVFSTHPMTGDRIVAAERFIDQHLPPREEYVISTSQHDAARAYLLGLLDERARMEIRYGPALRNRTN